MSLAASILTELKQCGVRWITWLPDSETSTMYDLITADPDLDLVGVCREDEAVGICYGLLLGGQRAVVMIQNTGLLNAVDAIRGMPILMKKPMLFLVGYRGYKGMIAKAARIDNVAIFTEPLLKALNIPYYLLDGRQDIHIVSQAYQQAQDICGPVVVLITKEFA